MRDAASCRGSTEDAELLDAAYFRKQVGSGAGCRTRAWRRAGVPAPYAGGGTETGHLHAARCSFGGHIQAGLTA